MSSSSSSSSAGVGIFGVLTAVLLVFKLAGMAGASWGLANLSWWVVFAPVLIGFGLTLLIIGVLVVIALASR